MFSNNNTGINLNININFAQYWHFNENFCNSFTGDSFFEFFYEFKMNYIECMQ